MVVGSCFGRQGLWQSIYRPIQDLFDASKARFVEVLVVLLHRLADHALLHVHLLADLPEVQLFKLAPPRHDQTTNILLCVNLDGQALVEALKEAPIA